MAQRISTAMAIASPEDTASAREEGVGESPSDSTASDSTSSLLQRPSTQPKHTPLLAVDTSSGLFCHPEPLPTPLGIPRLFVSSAHRRQGIATRLLTAAANTFVHGCLLDPLKGDVAFTQPTTAGNAVMQCWGKGFVRIYHE